jgi:hypothetical protein
MAQFKPGESGNTKGRPSASKQSARKIGAAKLKKLLKVLEPLADDSILVASEIMQDEDASQATRLKAAMTLLQKYTELNGEVYFEQLPKDEKEFNKTTPTEDGEGADEDDSQGGNLALFSSNKK